MRSYWVKRQRNKYGNVKVELDGQTFDSKKEARRYAELKLLEQAGEITMLKTQVKYELQPGFTDGKGRRVKPIYYIADFEYYTKDGDRVIEDVKSPATRKNTVYKMKKKMLAYQYGYEIQEV